MIIEELIRKQLEPYPSYLDEVLDKSGKCLSKEVLAWRVQVCGASYNKMEVIPSIDAITQAHMFRWSWWMPSYVTPTSRLYSNFSKYERLKYDNHDHVYYRNHEGWTVLHDFHRVLPKSRVKMHLVGVALAYGYFGDKGDENVDLPLTIWANTLHHPMMAMHGRPLFGYDETQRNPDCAKNGGAEKRVLESLPRLRDPRDAFDIWGMLVQYRRSGMHDNTHMAREDVGVDGLMSLLKGNTIHIAPQHRDDDPVPVRMVEGTYDPIVRQTALYRLQCDVMKKEMAV